MVKNELKIEEPKIEELKIEEPKIEEPKIEKPKIEKPKPVIKNKKLTKKEKNEIIQSCSRCKSGKKCHHAIMFLL